MSGFIKAAVIGHPVEHSKSPLIHNHWIEKYALEGGYEALDILPENLEKEIRRLTVQGYRGFNITVPHKEAAFSLCDFTDNLAQAVGAVNMINVQGGALHGTNTDVFGFAENIRSALPQFDFAAGPAAVLGAGGAARAVVYGLLQQGAPEIRIVNRTRRKAEDLARDLKIQLKIHDWEDRETALKGVNLLVNTTVLGMQGQPPLEIDLGNLPPDAAVNDIVYRPLLTPLLQQAQARGNPVVTGIGMLLQQARPAFAAWFDVTPEIDGELIEKGDAMIVVGLTGSIGMGKSVTAAMLHNLGIPVFEADAEVHRLLAPRGKAYKDVTKIFPYSVHPQIYGRKTKTGRRVLNRGALGELVFRNEKKRRALESVLHPLVRAAQKEFIRLHKAKGVKLAVLDIPLLFETGGDRYVDYTINVTAPPAVQRERVLARPGMNEKKFEAILKRQMPDREKCARADFVMQTGLGRAHTLKNLKTILNRIRKGSMIKP